MKPLRLHILSDVHLEFGKWPRQVNVQEIPCDVHVLAGDIGVGLSGLQWALEAFDRPVIYVMGNHEFYGQRCMAELWEKAREKVAGTHVHLLENEAVVIEGVRFLGTTLWTDFGLAGAEHQESAMRHGWLMMSDYQSICVSRTPSRRDLLTPRKTLALHHESRDYLERELRRSPDPLGIIPSETWDRVVVVTHHAPSARSLLYGESGGYGDTCYASALEPLVRQADLWIHGHTHVAVDYRVEGGAGGRVVSNPRGYVGSEPVEGFDPARVVEVL